MKYVLATAAFLFATAAIARADELDAAGDGYKSVFHYSLANPRPSAIVQYLGRKPTKAESPVDPGFDGYYFFSFASDSKEPLAIAQGATLDVTFPFALSTREKYTFWLGFSDPDINGVVGSIVNGNTLHFVLPAFSLRPGKAALGEIDGDVSR